MGVALRVPESDEHAEVGLLDELVVCRVADARGATRSELLRDLGALTSHKLSPSELRRSLDQALHDITASGRATETRSRYRLTETGRDMALSQLGGRALPDDWSEIRDVRLVARALDLHGQNEKRIKSIARPDGLRAAILQQAYRLPGRRQSTASRLRNALAVVALKRAFGNKIKSGIESGRGLSARAGRMLAGQLAQRPRDFGTDSRLIAALAAEACGSSQTDASSLRMAILRSAVARRMPSQQGQVETPPSAEEPAVAPSSTGEHIARPAAANRPDLPGFAAIVLAVADRHCEGWAGNRKAFINRVWATINEENPDWGLTEIEFKAMLAEAHRTGHIVLSNADLKSKSNAQDLQESAVTYMNTVWHYVRVVE